MFSEKEGRRKRYKRLGEILTELGYITEEELRKALEYKSRLGKPLGETLVELGYVTWDEIVHALSEQYGVGVLEDIPTDIPYEIINRLPRNVINELHVIPIGEEDGRLVVVSDGTVDIPRLESSIKFLTGKEPKILLTSPMTFSYLYKTFVEGSEDQLDVFDSFNILEEEEIEAEEIPEEENAPIVRLVSMIIHRAVEKDASDIHIEPMRNKVRVRFRQDGVLKNVMSYPRNQHNAVVIRVKIMANLDISERRRPQDGKFYMKIGGEQYDFRVSVMPTVYGEKVVMRILKVSSANKRLQDLGFNDYNTRRIEELLAHPYGIILVTGPTGSGKSTTLVAMLNELKSDEVNIVTAEDPVEYTIDGITQCQVRPEIGLTFAAYLRSFLRQDPDIIMVGEIRDRETAQLAIEASMTGHLVLSTLHTNDAASAIDRLLNLGVDPRLVGTSLVGVVAQRLVRKINRRCKTKKIPLRPDLFEYWEKFFEGVYEPVEYIVPETGECGDKYRGRTAIGEVLIVDDTIREKISEGVSVKELGKLAEDGGMRPMFIDGLEKVLKGETTVEEVLRVVQLPE